MKYLFSLSLLLLITLSLSAQENHLRAFEPLVGHTWVSEGKQLGGFDGKTSYEISWGLDGKMVKVKTFATDPATKAYGLRNEGVRMYNAATQKVEFYEFDKLGGVTTGTITTDGKNIHYQYEYQGMQLTDAWEYVDANTYKFVVGVLKEGKWLQTFHSALLKKQ